MSSDLQHISRNPIATLSSSKPIESQGGGSTGAKASQRKRPYYSIPTIRCTNAEDFVPTVRKLSDEQFYEMLSKLGITDDRAITPKYDLRLLPNDDIEERSYVTRKWLEEENTYLYEIEVGFARIHGGGRYHTLGCQSKECTDRSIGALRESDNDLGKSIDDIEDLDKHGQKRCRSDENISV